MWNVLLSIFSSHHSYSAGGGDSTVARRVGLWRISLMLLLKVSMKYISLLHIKAAVRIPVTLIPNILVTFYLPVFNYIAPWVCIVYLSCVKSLMFHHHPLPHLVSLDDFIVSSICSLSKPSVFLDNWWIVSQMNVTGAQAFSPPFLLFLFLFLKGYTAVGWVLWGLL